MDTTAGFCNLQTPRTGIACGPRSRYRRYRVRTVLPALKAPPAPRDRKGYRVRSGSPVSGCQDSRDHRVPLAKTANPAPMVPLDLAVNGVCEESQGSRGREENRAKPAPKALSGGMVPMVPKAPLAKTANPANPAPMAPRDLAANVVCEESQDSRGCAGNKAELVPKAPPANPVVRGQTALKVFPERSGSPASAGPVRPDRKVCRVSPAPKANLAQPWLCTCRSIGSTCNQTTTGCLPGVARG